MGLSNYQLILLDNLIYLDEVTRMWKEEATIGEVVNNLLYKDGNSDNGIGTGTILTDCHGTYQPDNPEAQNCMMSLDEWLQVLKAIEADETLCSLTIHKVEDHREGATDGFRAMALTGDNVDENIIIFKGTSSAEEWMEDGEGGYSITTAGQQLAVDFVNGIDIVNNKSFVVSGHSKGGNMAQYAALFATNPPIDRCLSFDGQGFSNELCNTPEYKEAIARRGQNLYLIASSGDYVNVLFNSPIPDNHKMYLAANNGVLDYVYFHKPNTIFKIQDNIVTGLNDMATMNVVSVFVQDFVAYILETEEDVEKKKIVFDGLMGILAATAESQDDLELGIEGISTEMVLALWAMPVIAVYSGTLSAFGMDEKNFSSLTFKNYTEILDDVTAKVYKGVIYKAISEGALDLMLGYLRDYVLESTSNLYSALALIDCVVSGGVFENLGDAGRLILDTYVKWPINLFDGKTGYSIEKYCNDVFNSFAVTSKLGEGTKGNVYIEQHEDGGMLYIGNGDSENSINGTMGNDILYGGNGSDSINGGAGNDVLWGGRGDDILNGGSGSDRYIFGLYDGNDIIKNNNIGNYKDYIVFDEDVTISDVSFEVQGLDLMIYVGELSHITVENFFAVNGNGKFTNAINTIQFMNGGELDFAEICRLAGYEGTGKDDKNNSLSEEEQEALEEERRQLKKWYEEYYKQKNSSENTGGTGSSSGSSGNSGGAEAGGGSGGSSSANEGDNSQNSAQRAKEEIFGRNPGAYQESMNTRQIDPIIVDLNGDGIFTTSLEDGVYFDLNKDGFAERTAWITTQDALLVRDVNGNGKIDDGGELFGDRTVLPDGSTAASGFQALAGLDDNEDGILDSQDKGFQELKVWMDTNHNGISEEEELYSLEHFGISSIDLNYSQVNRVDENGNWMKAGSNLFGQNANYNIGEYDFNIDFSDTKYQGEEIDTSILEKYLPEIKGCGTLLDLSKAMAINDELKIMVTLYIREKDYHVKKNILRNVLFLWADVASIEADSRGNAIDARRLGVLEKAYGQPYIGVSGANPNSAAATILNKLYLEFEQEIEECLLSQSVYKEALEHIKVYRNIDTQSCYCDFADAVRTLVKGQSVCYVPMFVDYILKNTNLGNIFDKQYIYEQLKSENEVWAETLNVQNIIYQSNNGNVTGSSGNDILLSGTEDEVLQGKKGNDIYIFNVGGGQDTIVESGGVDTILYGEGIREEDIRVSRDGRNLYLTNHKSGDKVTIRDFFWNTDYQVEKVEFADGSTWSLEDLKDKARCYYGGEENDNISAVNSNTGAPILEDDYLYGGAGNDTLSGQNGDDELYGEEGDDILYGGNGNDLLSGGAGEDYLYGQNGDDTYVFHLGDGQDTIVENRGTDTIRFGEGIREEDIRVSRDGRNLYLTNHKSGDKVTIRDFFWNTDYQVEKVEFADGSTWSLEDLKDKARCYYGGEENDNISAVNSNTGAPILEDDYLYGGAGNDTLNGQNGDDELYGEEGDDILYGGNGNDLLSGGTGNDTLNGGTGDDTYIFNFGDGQDTIVENRGTDIIRFGEGICEEDIRVSRDGRNLYLTNQESGDKVTIRDFFWNTDYQVEKVEFADGSTWSLEDLKDKARCYYGGEENDNISAVNSNTGAPILEDDYLYGGAGNDTLNGQNGDDELYGEEGDDILYGGNGNDLLSGGTGNDTLNGGTGDDTYIFNFGDGQDIIVEGRGTDTIRFGEGIREEDIRVSRDGRNLYLTNQESGDKVTIRDFFWNTDYQVEKVEFADGGTWSLEDLKDKARYYYGGEESDNISAANSNTGAPILEDDYLYGGAGDDTLYGNNGDDELYGEEGNDFLYGGNGNDLLNGGKGKDTLRGQNGDDTYIFNLGDGQDTIMESSGDDRIIFGEGIEYSNLKFAKQGNNLNIFLTGGDDSITVLDYFRNDNYKVESFHTSDGRVLDYTKINVMIQAMASFEDTTGMTWEDAVGQKNEQANDLLNQWWTKEAI